VILIEIRVDFFTSKLFRHIEFFRDFDLTILKDFSREIKVENLLRRAK